LAADLDLLVASAERLPTPPAVALELLALAQRDDVDVDQVAAVIARDPAIVSKILRVANTPLFGARKVTTIKQALMTLGLRSVQVMALSFSLVRPPSSHDGGFDYVEFWRGSLATAVAARLLAARFLPRLQDDCFVAGLLLDLGILAGRQAWPAKYDYIASASRGKCDDGAEMERALLGADHMELGAHLLKRWGVPDLVTTAVAYHHRPDALPETTPEPIRKVTHLMELAAAFSRCLRHDVSGKDDTPLSRDLAWLNDRLTSELGCDGEELGKLLQEVRAGLRQAAAAFDLQLGDPRAIEELQVKTGQLLVRLSLGLAHEADALEASRRELADLAALDGLTGLPNRRTLEARYAELFESARAAGRPLGVVMIDLDLFKQVNDRHGHQAGDELLQSMGRALQASRRDGELIARYGGEEFCCVVPAGSSVVLEARAEGLRAAIASLHVARPGGVEVHATASIGAAFAPTAAAVATKEELRDAADRALYAAKEQGRDRVVVAVLGPEALSTR